MSYRHDPRYVQVCYDIWPDRPWQARRPLTRSDVREVQMALVGNQGVEPMRPPEGGGTATRWAVNHDWTRHGDNTKYRRTK